MRRDRNPDDLSFEQVLAEVARLQPHMAARCEEARQAVRALDRDWLACQAEHERMHRELYRRHMAQAVYQ